MISSDKRINVLIDARWIRDGKRGIGVFTYSLISNLAKIIRSDVNITVVVPAKMIDGFKSEFGSVFEVVSLPNLPDPLLDFIFFPYYLFFHKVDVLHLTGNSGVGLFGSNCKIVLTVHDVSFLKNKDLVPWPKKTRQIVGRLYRKLAVPFSAKVADRIITVSEFAALDIQNELGMAKRPEFVYHGVDLINSQNNNFPHLEEVKNKYLVISGSDPQKNIDCIISAFSLMYDQQHISFPEVFIIGISLEQYKIKVKITPNIHFLGYQSYEYVQAAIGVSKCIIIPSYYESFGLPLIESLFNFKPVICSERGALKEIGGDIPFYFDPSSAESLINAVIKFESVPSIVSSIKNWVFDNSKRFDWGKTAKHYLRLYCELCNIDLS